MSETMCNTANEQRSIKSLRVDLNLTQEGLAKKLGVSKKTVCSWEKGYTVPSLKKVEEICAFFGVRYDSIRWKV